MQPLLRVQLQAQGSDIRHRRLAGPLDSVCNPVTSFPAWPASTARLYRAVFAISVLSLCFNNAILTQSPSPLRLLDLHRLWRSGVAPCYALSSTAPAVSYTHLTLPTILLV